MVVNVSSPSGHDPLQPVAAVSAPREVFRDWQYGYPDGSAGYGSRGVSWVGEVELVFGSEASGFVHAVVAATAGATSRLARRVRAI